MATSADENIERLDKTRSQLSLPEKEIDGSLRQLSKKSKKFSAPSQRNVSHTTAPPVQPSFSPSTSACDILDEGQARNDNVCKPDTFVQSRCEITAINNPCFHADPRYSYCIDNTGASDNEKDQSNGQEKTSSDYKPDTFLLSRCEISATNNPCLQPDARYTYHTDAIDTADPDPNQSVVSFGSTTNKESFDHLHAWNFGI
jgi:hypothetical protein